MRQWIRTLDGLMFLTAIGILLTNSWIYHIYLRFYIGKLDKPDIFPLGENGVDLFFSFLLPAVLLVLLLCV